MSLDYSQFHKSHQLFTRQSFNSDSNWLRFPFPFPSLPSLRIRRLALERCACTYTNMQQTRILDLFSLGSALAPIKVNTHPTPVHVYRRTGFLLRKVLIYIQVHPHLHTHSSLFSMCHFYCRLIIKYIAL